MKKDISKTSRLSAKLDKRLILVGEGRMKNASGFELTLKSLKEWIIFSIKELGERRSLFTWLYL